MRRNYKNKVTEEFVFGERRKSVLIEAKKVTMQRLSTISDYRYT
jgi:hypothetical protein